MLEPTVALATLRLARINHDQLKRDAPHSIKQVQLGRVVAPRPELGKWTKCLLVLHVVPVGVLGEPAYPIRSRQGRHEDGQLGCSLREARYTLQQGGKLSSCPRIFAGRSSSAVDCEHKRMLVLVAGLIMEPVWCLLQLFLRISSLPRGSRPSPFPCCGCFAIFVADCRRIINTPIASSVVGTTASNAGPQVTLPFCLPCGAVSQLLRCGCGSALAGASWWRRGSLQRSVNQGRTRNPVVASWTYAPTHPPRCMTDMSQISRLA